jgi:predicted RNase H-like HicB family nuclease
MTQRHSYKVEVVRSGDWWAITVPDLEGVLSQAKRLDQVGTNARAAIALILDIEESDVGDLDVFVTPPPNVADLLNALRDSTMSAAAAAEEASKLRLEAARALHEQGLSMRDVGALIGISHQRVHQLLAG